jgi:hypothetical protein
VPRKFSAAGAGRLATYGFHSKVADMPCAKGGRTDQVAIQFERTDTHPPAIAHSDAVKLLYGDGRSLVLRFEPVLCPPKVHTREMC